MLPEMKARILGFIEAFKDLCFPPLCLSCGANLPSGPPLFCLSCRANVRLIRSPFCSCCGKPFPFSAGGSHLCGFCLKSKWQFSEARSIFQYNGCVPKIVHSFKYSGSTVALKTFFALKKELPHLDHFSDVDLIIPVPLHVKRLRKRGFNQALLLAKALLPECRSKISPYILERQRRTVPQTGLSGVERRRNLKNAFQVCQPAEVRGKRILLVDDIFTTGSTVNECAGTLRRAGAKEIMVLTLALVSTATG